MLSYLIIEFLSNHRKSLSNYWKDLKLVIIFVSFGIGLSPVLFKLTDTISTDSIYSMTSAMLFIHLVSCCIVNHVQDDRMNVFFQQVFQDYGLQISTVSSPLSLNAGLFAAICLASRLNSRYAELRSLSLLIVQH